MKHNIFHVFVALTTGVMIFGCSQNVTGPSNPTVSGLVGTWVMFSANDKQTSIMHFGIAGMHDSTTTFDTTITLTGTSNYAQLNANMTYSIQIPAMVSITGFSYSDTGSWSLSGNALRLISTFNDTTFYTASINGNNGAFVNTSSVLTNNPSGTLPNSYLQTTTILTIWATKQ